MPIPAEAKLAPAKSFSPLSRGLKYGNTDSIPSFWPDNQRKNKFELHTKIKDTKNMKLVSSLCL